VVWAREGFIDLTPGKSIEYEYVAIQLAEILRGVNIQKIAFDRWNFKNLKPWLLKAGFEEKELEEKFVEFGQGYQSMSPALRFVESLLLSGKLAHGNNPVLTMCAGSAVVTRDPAGNRKLNKVKSRKRIDGMICLAMAAGLAESTPVEQPKEFQVIII
jgi:phage terminase large subunit-like protein